MIDELTKGRQAGALSRAIEPSRIGIAGHSIGGASAAATMAADHRVRAGVDLDGDFFLHAAAAGLGGRPFMMLGAESTHWKRWLTVTGAEHFSFTDLPYLAGQLGLSDPASPLSGERGWYITRDYVAAFFDLHLRGVPQPILDGPVPAYPEVVLARLAR